MMSDVLSLLALFVSSIALAFTIHKGLYDKRVGVKPVLVFVYDRNEGWVIQNIGSGPALNVVVATHQKSDGASLTQWEDPTRVPPLKKDGSFQLYWLSSDDVFGLGATCEDIWERPYSTICVRDLNTVKPGKRLREWADSEIVQEWTRRPETIDAVKSPPDRIS